ncbi:hypothetical protein FGO68_gene16206 [Halteria grandinella]|uniref:Uncharacterized protein n=1 Tax=Halteria grandinella TaxID=5974 RepID=A0A8J8NDU4_HALGN|nr:hypothetical protein FGO68_gene16206 [Halteria grandinella]
MSAPGTPPNIALGMPSSMTLTLFPISPLTYSCILAISLMNTQASPILAILALTPSVNAVQTFSWLLNSWLSFAERSRQSAQWVERAGMAYYGVGDSSRVSLIETKRVLPLVSKACRCLMFFSYLKRSSSRQSSFEIRGNFSYFTSNM